MKKFLIKISYYAILTFCIGNAIAFIATHFLSKSHFYKSSFLVNAFETEDSFDYFIVGSSRGLTTLNSSQIDIELGLKGVNLSMDDTDLKTQLLMIQHFFNSGYQSKYCVLSLDDTHFEKTSRKLGNNDYRFAMFSNRNYVHQHYKDYETGKIKVLQNAKLTPFMAYSYYNLELLMPAALSAIKPKYRNRFDTTGNYYYPNLKNNKILKETKSQVKDLKIKNPLLEEIIEILQKNNCELIIYIAPYRYLSYEGIVDDTRYQLINHSKNLQSQDLFYDALHVNFRGREKATFLFAEAFKKIKKNNNSHKIRSK